MKTLLTAAASLLLPASAWASASTGTLHALCTEGASIHEEELQTALQKVAPLAPEQAKALLVDLESKGMTPDHLGWGLLLSVRSQGFAPVEAVYCSEAQPAPDRPRKWLGVRAADGRQYLLDLTQAAQTGAGMALVVAHDEKVVAEAAGGKVTDLLAGRNLAGKVMEAIKGADYRAWFDGSASRKDLAAQPAVYAAGGGSWSDDPSLPFTPPWRGKVGGTVPSPVLEAADRKGGAGSAVLAAFQEFQRRFFPSVFFPVLSRSDWGAAASRGASRDADKDKITVHNTAGAQTMSRAETLRQVRGIQSYHQNDKGWADVGYHFLIDGQGRIVEGRALDKLGAHTEGHNSGNIGVALMGDFDKGKPTSAQVESLKRLVVFLSMRFGISPLTGLFGHGDFNNTDCPGTRFIAALRAMKAQLSSQTASLAAAARETWSS
ncbi:MAG TPA: hypothetical protein DCM05_15705 [Elusimicrobia bacterium]|nr:hypothetical protein [Elusimicrobiota bacterium]